MRGGTRLFYVAGGRLRRLLATHHQRAARLRQLLGTSDEELVAAVTAKLDQIKEAQRVIRGLEEELAVEAARVLATGSEKVTSAHWDLRDLPFLQRLAREFVRLAPARLALLTAGEGAQASFVLAVGDQLPIDVTAAGRQVAEILVGLGGGSGRMFQGKATVLSHRDDALAKLRGLVQDG